MNHLKNYKNIASNTLKSLQEMQTAGKVIKSYLPVSVPDSVNGLRVPVLVAMATAHSCISPCLFLWHLPLMPSSIAGYGPSSVAGAPMGPGENPESERDQTPGLRHRQVHGQRKGKEAKPGIHSLLPTGRWVFIDPQVSRAASQAVVTWGHKCHHFQHPPLPPSPPSFQTDSYST